MDEEAKELLRMLVDNTKQIFEAVKKTPESKSEKRFKKVIEIVTIGATVGAIFERGGYYQNLVRRLKYGNADFFDSTVGWNCFTWIHYVASRQPMTDV